MRRIFSVILCIFLLSFWMQRAKSQEAKVQPQPVTQEKIPVYPLDAVVSSDGKSAFVIDRNLPGVWRWDGEKLSIFSQGSKKFREPLNAARSIAWEADGKLLVGDSSTREVYRVSSDGKLTPITGGEIGIPMDIAVKSDGTIYVADLETHYLLRIPAGSSKVERIAQVNPRGVFVDSQQNVWVISQDAQQLLVVSDDGKKEVIVDSRVFEFPHQVVVNSAGEAFVSDGYRKAIWKVVRGEKPSIVVEGAPLDNPVGLAIRNDELYVVDPRAAKVFKLSAAGKLESWIDVVR